ncbi:MAG: efflux RND transporter periplasmic adaptor subunit [Pseudomonadota bacterium]
MIAFLTLVYVGTLAILVKLRILPNKITTWMTTLAWVVLLFFVLFIPMNWGAPAGSMRIFVPTVQIIPNVAGPVTEVPVASNVPISKGDILFKLDPTIFEASVRSIEAQLKFENLRLEQFTQLAERNAGTRFQVEQTQAQVDRLKADLETAKWKLDQAVVRAPSDGYVTSLTLLPGQRVTNFPFQPAMTFFNTEERVAVVQIQQTYLRHIEIGQPVEIAFKRLPGRIMTGKVDALIPVTSEGQVIISGTIQAATQIQSEPFFVRVALDQEALQEALPPGSVGTAAIYTKSMVPTHIIRKVMLRMEAIVNYFNPWL